MNTRFLLFISLLLQFASFQCNAEAGSLFNKNNSLSSSNEQEFLPASEAFRIESSIEGNIIRFHWTIAEGYYLYKHRFSFKHLAPNNALLGTHIIHQKGKTKEDPTFGTVEAYYHNVDISVPVIAPTSGSIEVQVSYQGCADKGLCYIPQKATMYFPLVAANLPSESASPSSPSEKSTSLPSTTGSLSTNSGSPDTESAQGLASVLDESSLFAIIGIFFVLGLGLTFTPCVLPMIPILSGIIVGQGKDISRRKAFMLSLAYVLGMAITYAIAGVIAGSAGYKLQLYMQNPTVLYTFAGVFVLLSLSMFGFYELQLPSAIQNRLNDFSNKQKGGTLFGVAIMGALSAVIVSPCVSAPLAGALIYIGNTGDSVLGGISLLALGLGMGAPLLVIGTTGGNILPKAGGWMDSIKGLFGVGLLAVALWLVKHLIPENVALFFIAMFVMIAAVYLGAFQVASTPKAQLFKAIGLTLTLLSAAIMLSSTGLTTNISTSTAQKVPSTGLAFSRIRTQSALDQALASAAAAKRPVMIDYYADWCISCVELEHEAFQNPTVMSLLSNHTLLQIDLTDNDQAESLLDRFNLQGPPSILFFDEAGQELTHARIYAYTDETSFVKRLNQTLGQ